MDDARHGWRGRGGRRYRGLLIGVAAMLIPGIGPIVAIGPLTAALTGAVTGGIMGAVVRRHRGCAHRRGGARGRGRTTTKRFREGGILLTVHAEQLRYDEAQRSCSAMAPTRPARETAGSRRPNYGNVPCAARR